MLTVKDVDITVDIKGRHAHTNYLNHKINHENSVIFIITRIQIIIFHSRALKREVKLNHDHNRFLILNSKNHKQYCFLALKQHHSIEIIYTIVLLGKYHI